MANIYNPYFLLKVNPTGIESIILGGRTENEELASLGIYTKVKEIIGEIDKTLKSGREDKK